MVTNADPIAQPRVPLSRERVLRAAIVLADESGIESLSMRHLGQELGVEAMSLYNHVANKDDIIAGIVDSVVSEFDMAPGRTGWEADLRRIMMSAHEVLLRHAWACSILMSAASVGPARLEFMDSVLRTLRDAGFSVRLSHLGFHALDIHLMGHTMSEANFQFDSAELADMGERFLQGLPAGEYPHMVEHVRYHLGDPKLGLEDDFGFGLGLILEGLERRRDTL
jgi:AcrR family transcriptional regulator